MAITLSGTDGVDQADVSGATTIPRGTTAERPANPADGMIRYNTDEEYIEYYNSDRAEWLPTSDTELPVQATGGTVTEITENGVDYRVHTFTSSGTFDVTFAPANAEVEYLVVAGGGGGGSTLDSNLGGGGGGGGGLLTETQTVSAQSYPVAVGAGGAGGVNTIGTNGDNSSVFDNTAIGGGAGATRLDNNDNAASGGSGGGGTWAGSSGDGVAGQGNPGGRFGSSSGNPAGGGGAGEPGKGGAQESGLKGDGGDGLNTTISGASTFYAGGGAAGNSNVPNRGQGCIGGLGGGGDGGESGSETGESGGVNTGGGGGGGGDREGNGGSGGSGIVIIRYPI